MPKGKRHSDQAHLGLLRQGPQAQAERIAESAFRKFKQASKGLSAVEQVFAYKRLLKLVRDALDGGDFG